ncbi:MAG: hypothetical protein HFJ96_09065 [Peptococcaceae bacterium]|jgi:hypothetical protein|nr:hypothetical protein [Peptococcaceae bacterium]
MTDYQKRIGLIGLSGMLAVLLLCKFCLSVGEASALDFSNTVLVGQIEELEGSRATLQLGRLRVQTPPAKPDDDDKPGESEPPVKPGNGEEPPAKPDEKTDGSERVMQLQNQGRAQATTIPQTMENPSTSVLLLSNDTEAKGDEAGADKPNELYSFESDEDSLTLDLAGVEIKVEEPLKTRSGSLAELAVGDVLEIEIGEQGMLLLVTVKNVAAQNALGQVEQGTAANLLTEDEVVRSETYTSKGDDENALRVSGASVSLEDVQVHKQGGASSNTENGDFYGMNAALLATDGALLTISKAEISSDAPNGNGVFSYGEGTVISINKSSIETLGDNSGGLQTTGGATMNAVDVQVSTAGSSSAAIRSDRGGGTVNVIGGSYRSSGLNSPAVYSTADITVMNAELTAENSEALVIEGKNAIKLLDCQVSGQMSSTQGASSDENVHNVMIYQSMSGDAEIGTSEFSAQGGRITSQNGDMFYVTNTHCLMTLDGVELIDESESGGLLLRVCGNSGRRGWGVAGANGGQVELLAKHQHLAGDVQVDSVSTLSLQLTEGSVLTGAINIVENAAGGEAVPDNVSVSIAEGCAWNLTGDCTISSLENAGTINFNGHTITLADGQVLRG